MNTIQGIVLNTDGTWKPLQDIELKTLQEAVGGYVTCATEMGYTVWANDDGISLQLPFNPSTFVLYGLAMFGDCVITGGSDVEGNTLPIDDSHIRKIMSVIPIDKKYISSIIKNDVIRQAILDSI